MDTDNCKNFQDTEKMSTNKNIEDVNEKCSSTDVEDINEKCPLLYVGHKNISKFTDTVFNNNINCYNSSTIDRKVNLNTQNDHFILYDKSLNIEEIKVIEILSRHVNIKSELLKAPPDFKIFTHYTKNCYEQTIIDNSFVSNNNSFSSSVNHLQSTPPHFTIDFPLTEDILMTEIKEEILSQNKKRKKYVINKPKRKYFCEKCGSKFTSSYGMKYHIDKVHTKEKDQVVKPFNCPFEKCTKKYKNNNGLKYHLKNQHD